ncbi:Trypanosomal VSG domain [Trypanosoma vivax]|nr:Trypanosomal VSG domain [Trypanosoma vivax]
MIAALATLRARLKPDKAATDNPTNTYCLGQAGNQGCDATSNQQEACVCYAKETAETTGGLPGWAPTAVEIAARMREAAQLERQIHSLREEANAPPTQTSDGATLGNTQAKRRDDFARQQRKRHSAQPPESRRTGNTQSETTRQGPRLRETKAARRTVNANVTERTRTGTKHKNVREHSNSAHGILAAAACVAQLTAVRPV